MSQSYTQQIQDLRAESYAAGSLGTLYKYQHQYNKAQQYSNWLESLY